MDNGLLGASPSRGTSLRMQHSRVVSPPRVSACGEGAEDGWELNSNILKLSQPYKQRLVRNHRFRVKSKLALKQLRDND